MSKSVLIRSAIVASIVFGAASVASASTVTVSKQYSRIFGTNAAMGVKIYDDDVSPAGMNAQAGGFALNSSSLGNFVAWCLDITTVYRDSKQYRETTDNASLVPFASSTPLSMTQKANVQALFDQNYATLDLNDQVKSAAFQLALWEVVNEDDGTFDVTSGSFYATSWNITKATANAFLAGLSSTAAKAYDLVFLESAAHISQNLVTAVPTSSPPPSAVVPLPATGLLLLGALGGFGALRRRKKS